jgi:hypothetical protein
MVDIVYAKSTRCNVFLHMRKQSPGIIRTMTTEKRPPSDRGQGRKPISPSGEAMTNRVVRFDDELWSWCKVFGGGAFIRETLSREVQKRIKASGATKEAK